SQSGNTLIEPNNNNGAANDIQMEKVTSTTTGTLNSISVYFSNADTAPNNKFQVALYANNAGSPGAKIASSGDATITPFAWNTVTLSASVTSGTSYWVGINVKGSTDATVFASSGGNY